MIREFYFYFKKRRTYWLLPVVLLLLLMTPLVFAAVNTNTFTGLAGPAGGNGVYGNLLRSNETIVVQQFNSTNEGGSASPVTVNVYNFSSLVEVGIGKALGTYYFNMTNSTGGNLTLYANQNYLVLSNSTLTAGVMYSNGRSDNITQDEGGVSINWAFRYTTSFSSPPSGGSWNTANGIAGGIRSIKFSSCISGATIQGCPQTSSPEPAYPSFSDLNLPYGQAWFMR